MHLIVDCLNCLNVDGEMLEASGKWHGPYSMTLGASLQVQKTLDPLARLPCLGLVWLNPEP